MKSFLAFVVLLAVPLTIRAGPEGSGKATTGGDGKTAVTVAFGSNMVSELTSHLKNGGVHVKLSGSGTVALNGQWIEIGSDSTLDGSGAKITFSGLKGLYVKGNNVHIKGLKFDRNYQSINAPNGVQKLFIEKCTFTTSGWGSHVAIEKSSQVTVQENLFTDTTYGPLFYLGTTDASIIRNCFKKVYTRIPRAENTGVFHVCNNYFESWHLGFQAAGGAHILYEHNVFHRVNTTMQIHDLDNDKDGTKGTFKSAAVQNNWFMNTAESGTICLSGNVVLPSSDTSLSALKTTGNEKIEQSSCSFSVSFKSSCPAISGEGSICSNAGAGY